MASPTELRDLKKTLQTDQHSDDAVFSAAVAQSMALLALSDGEIAAEFDMSRPSVNRWRNGRAAPHPAVRKHVFKFFAKKIERLIALEADEDSSVRLRSAPPQDLELLAARSSR